MNNAGLQRLLFATRSIRLFGYGALSVVLVLYLVGLGLTETDTGLLLTTLWYIRPVDPTTLLLTGLTRDGVYLVENGEVTAEVDHNFRFNYSPLDVLRRTTEVGATERTLPREWKDWFTRAAMPPVRVPEFFMSSVSLGR